MKYCKNCGHQVYGGKFCPYCGASLKNEKNAPVKKHGLRLTEIFIVSVIVIVSALSGAAGVYFYEEFKNHQTDRISEKTTDDLDSEMIKVCGKPLKDMDLISNYWPGGIDYVSGNYKGEEGIITTAATDLNDDGKNETVVFYRKNKQIHSKQYDLPEKLNVWTFHCSVWEKENGVMREKADRILFSFNEFENDYDFNTHSYTTEENVSYPSYDYPEYFNASVHLKDTDYGKEILLYLWFTAVGSNFGYSDSPDIVYGYRYDGNSFSQTGSFNFSEYQLKEAPEDIRKLGFSSDKNIVSNGKSGKESDPIDGSGNIHLQDCKRLFYMGVTENISDESEDRIYHWAFEDSNDLKASDLKGYTNVISTFVDEKS